MLPCVTLVPSLYPGVTSGSFVASDERWGSGQRQWMTYFAKCWLLAFIAELWVHLYNSKGLYLCLSLTFFPTLIGIFFKLLFERGCFKLSFAERLTDCLEFKLKVTPSLFRVINFLCNIFQEHLALLLGHLMHNRIWATLSSVVIIQQPYEVLLLLNW